MKKIVFLMTMATMFNITTSWSQNWVGFTKLDPAKPEITVTRSDNQQVSFTVALPGFFSTLKTEAGVDYQRLSIPGYGNSGLIGEPEIPVITQRIAVPVCNQVNCSVQITARQSLSNYRVYPVPTLQHDSVGTWHEIFTINSAAYLQNAFTPAQNYNLAETGALREQHFVTLKINPIRFNPVTGQLEVATQMEIKC
jgi:hypothetical protein